MKKTPKSNTALIGAAIGNSAVGPGFHPTIFYAQELAASSASPAHVSDIGAQLNISP
jgi:hypothetical protein